MTETLDDFVNECCDLLPEWLDGDVAAEELVLRWLRMVNDIDRDHYVVYGETGWTVEHSLECRLRREGFMHECPYHEAIALTAADEPGHEAMGRWRITHIDDEGCPSLERAKVAR